MKLASFVRRSIQSEAKNKFWSRQFLNSFLIKTVFPLMYDSKASSILNLKFDLHGNNNEWNAKLVRTEMGLKSWTEKSVQK